MDQRRGEQDNRNQEIAEKLEQGGPEFPQNIAYRMAAGKVASHPEPIQSGKDAQKNVEGIGKTMASKIDEILETGNLNQSKQGGEDEGKRSGGHQGQQSGGKGQGKQGGGGRQGKGGDDRDDNQD